MGNDYHTPVLVSEVLQTLHPSGAGVYVDATLGGGGHSRNILEHLSQEGRVVGFDMDTDAVNHATSRLSDFTGKFTIVNDNFINLRRRLAGLGIQQIKGILFDLGVSSHQLDSIGRGFSYRLSSRLDMRMSGTNTLDAWHVVNTYDEARLASVLWEFGEERNSRRIAKQIVRLRLSAPIDSTTQLAAAVESVAGGRWAVKTLSRVFQALRIEVNGELANLRQALKDAVDLLQQKGRIVVISYHSLEDRIVKQFFTMESKAFEPPEHPLLAARPRERRLSIITKKPIIPSRAEVAANSRASGAKLRAAERV